jgi:hypothetical protein
MASIERTAYPRFPRTLTLKDLHATFTPRPEEIECEDGTTVLPFGSLVLPIHIGKSMLPKLFSL